MKSNKSILLSLFITVFVDMIGIGIVIPVFPMLFKDVHAGIFPPIPVGASVDAIHAIMRHRFIIYGFLAACYPLAQFFGAPLLGALADRHGRKPLLLASLCGTLIGYVLFAYSVYTGNLWLMFSSRAFAGFMGGNIAIAFSSIADVSSKENKTKNFGLIGMSFGLGFILGPFIGGKLADPSVYHGFGYSTPFIGASILAALNLIIVTFIYKETIKTKINSKINLATGFINVFRAFSLPDLRTIFVVTFLLTFGFTFFSQFIQLFLNDKFSFSPSQIGDVFAFIGIWIAFTQGVLVRVFAKKFSPKQIIRVCSFVLGTVFIILVLPDQKYLLYFIFPFIAITQGMIGPNTMTIISGQAGSEAQGEILGINQSVQALAQAIPPIVAGFIVSIKIELPILVAAGCTLLAGFIFIVFFRSKNVPEFREK